jgi:hypothetical protein
MWDNGPNKPIFAGLGPESHAIFRRGDSTGADCEITPRSRELLSPRCRNSGSTFVLCLPQSKKEGDEMRSLISIDDGTHDGVIQSLGACQ